MPVSIDGEEFADLSYADDPAPGPWHFLPWEWTAGRADRRSRGATKSRLQPSSGFCSDLRPASIPIPCTIVA